VNRLQSKLRQFDRSRGWHEVGPEHTFLHLVEELGEVARELLGRAAYKDASGNLAGELADVALLLYKLADQLGVDLEEAALEKLAENEKRFPLEYSRLAMERYQKRRDED
jgi:NTP pyrophosphatase (non-canonical NTP hydrolase)